MIGGPAGVGWTAVVLCLVAVSSPASARADGNGIKLGGGRLHPYVEAETHQVVNPAFAPPGGDPAPTNDVFFLVRPGGKYELKGTSMELKLDASVDYRRYFGMENDATRELSTFSGAFGGNALFNSDGAVAVRVRQQVMRHAEPGNQTISRRLLHLTSDTGLGLDIKPGGGALIFTVDYGFFYDRYDRGQNAAAAPEVLDNLRHKPELKATWKFLPKTAIFLQAQGVIARFPNDPGLASNIVQAYLGVVGNVSMRASILLKAGYGNTFASGSENFSSGVGQAEVTYSFGDSANLKSGVVRGVEPTSLFGYFSFIRGYLEWDQMLMGSTTVSAKLEYTWLDFAEPASSVADDVAIRATLTQRTDRDAQASLGISHHVNDWLTVGLIERFNLRSSSHDEIFGYRHNDVAVRASFVY